MEIIIILLLISAILNEVAVLFSIKRSDKLLCSQYFENSKSLMNPPNVIVTIPVLREQKIIKETLEYFESIGVDILLITSSLEKGDNTTESIVLTLNINKLRVLKCPVNGNKSEQLNYAIDNFSVLYPTFEPENTFFAFYDADSRPEKNIIKIFYEVHKRENANIYQQSSSYLSNYSSLGSNWLERGILRSVALKQTRFSYGHEIPRIIRAVNYNSGKKNFYNMITYSPTIGHGLFVKVSLLKKIKFPSNYTPEDMFWGFMVNSIGERITLIPSLDNAEIPDNILKVFHQYASWIKGPALAFRYAKYLRGLLPIAYEKNKNRIHFMICYAIVDAIKWTFSSFLISLFIVFSFMNENIATLFVIYLSIYLIGINIIYNARIISGVYPLNDRILVSVFSLIILLLYSIPAFVSAVCMIFGKYINNKTER